MSIPRADQLGGLRVDSFPSRDAFMAELGRRLNEGRPASITFVNPYAWHKARRDPGYLQDLAGMDYVLPDGIAVAWRARAKRLSFDDSNLARPFFAMMAEHDHSVLLIGGEASVAKVAAVHLAHRHPGLQITGTDGYRSIEDLVTAVMSPRLVPQQHPLAAVVIGMGTGQQERLAVALREAGYRGVVQTCGGYLDQLVAAHGGAYYPAAIDRLQLRWLYRIWREPRRLWRRCLLHYPSFLLARPPIDAVLDAPAGNPRPRSADDHALPRPASVDHA